MKLLILWLLILFAPVFVLGADHIVTVAPSGGTYSDLKTAVTTEACDIQTTYGDGNDVVIQITGSWNATTGYDTVSGQVNVSTSWITDNNNRLIIYTDSQARHDGTWDADSYLLTGFGSAFTGSLLDIDADYVEVYGLRVEVQYSSTSGKSAIGTSASSDSSVIAYCIVNGSANTGSNPFHGIDMRWIGEYIYNNIVYDCNQSTTAEGIYNAPPSGAVSFIYNNTLVNCGVGLDGYASRTKAVNNLFQGCVDRTSAVSFVTGSDYNTTDSSDFEYTQSTSYDNTSATIIFEGADDFHLATQQHNDGQDLSAYFTDGIDGDTRSNWNRGADEYISGTSKICIKGIKD